MDRHPRKCASAKSNGELCDRWAIKGGTVCPSHGGSAPQVKAAAKIRAAELQAHTVARRMVTRAGINVDPIEHLLDSLHLSSMLVGVWGEMVAALDAEGARQVAGGLRGEIGYERVEVEGVPVGLDVRSKDTLLALDRSGMAKLHPFVVEYQAAIERRARLAKLCIDANVTERQITLAEQQGQLIAQVLKGVLTDLGVADRPDAPAIVRRHLALVSSASRTA